MLLKLGITLLIHNKDDIEFVTEFPCFFGHPVACICRSKFTTGLHIYITFSWKKKMVKSEFFGLRKLHVYFLRKHELKHALR